MGDDGRDDNPSVVRTAGWALQGWADFGPVGGTLALAVALWARFRHWIRAVAAGD